MAAKDSWSWTYYRLNVKEFKRNFQNVYDDHNLKTFQYSALSPPRLSSCVARATNASLQSPHGRGIQVHRYYPGDGGHENALIIIIFHSQTGRLWTTGCLPWSASAASSSSSSESPSTFFGILHQPFFPILYTNKWNVRHKKRKDVWTSSSITVYGYYMADGAFTAGG